MSDDGVPGPGGSWDVQNSVPLKAVFFLSQSPKDDIESISSTQAYGMLMESARQESGLAEAGQRPRVVRGIHFEQMVALQKMAACVPAFILHVSLSGSFWELMEDALDSRAAADGDSEFGSNTEDPSANHWSMGRRQTAIEASEDHVVYVGRSMFPTLEEPELLDVKPYGDRRIRVGDVVYFRRRGAGRGVVHRAVRVTRAGVRTRGDNNVCDDADFVSPSDIVGQVVASRRSDSVRSVAGGFRGILRAMLVRLAYRPLRRLACRLGGKRIVRRFRNSVFVPVPFHVFPARFRVRVVAFKTRSENHLKLMIGRRVLGHYCDQKREWHIRPAFRLFIDRSSLPKPNQGL